jgi:catechol 2,3-dioxygenase-like lactoylglutathione lyase family enzyme
MDYKLEVVVLPVSDIDDAITFYTEKFGFNLDHDNVISEDARVVQLTPPGSACSVVIGTGVIPFMEPGAVQGVQLVVDDIDVARDELLGRGLDPGESIDMGGIKFLFFKDPDGNGWSIQEWPPKAGWPPGS